MTAVGVTTTPNFAPGSTTPLFSDPYFSWNAPASYDVSADGRFVMVGDAGSGEPRPPTIHVVENWYEEFRDREQD